MIFTFIRIGIQIEIHIQSALNRGELQATLIPCAGGKPQSPMYTYHGFLFRDGAAVLRADAVPVPPTWVGLGSVAKNMHGAS